MVKHILLPVISDAAEALVFEAVLAVSLGALEDLCLPLVPQQSGNAATGMVGGARDGGDSVGPLMETIEREDIVVEATAGAAAAAFRQAQGLDGSGLPRPGHSVETHDEATSLIVHGRTAARVGLGRARGSAPVGQGLPQPMLGGIGRSLLLASAHALPAQLETIVDAWKDSAETARGVTAAMHFIAGVRRVPVIGIDDEATPGSPPDDAGRALTGCLLPTLRLLYPEMSDWHLPLVEATTVEVFQAIAATANASLLVMGGYDNGEPPEMPFGGFTRSVPGGAAVPLRMMH